MSYRQTRPSVPFLRLNASQLSDFGRPRASPCNDTPYESEITTARLKFKSRFSRPGGDLANPGDVLRGEDGPQVRDQARHKPSHRWLAPRGDDLKGFAVESGRVQTDIEGTLAFDQSVAGCGLKRFNLGVVMRRTQML